jgi:hypothetical protein
MDEIVSDETWLEISMILESYLLRRAICNLGTKNYNRIFLALAKNLRKDGFSSERLRQLLLAQTGESVLWPDDAMFHEAWIHKPLYGPLNSPKLVYLFGRLNQTYMSSKSESLFFSIAPTIEHIMPQEWEPNWLLPDGTKGMDFFELLEASENDSRAAATRKRNARIQTLGNLTILSSGLNSAQSNSAWDTKRGEMAKHSLLPINQYILTTPIWDEEAILQRGEDLFARAVKIWSR